MKWRLTYKNNIDKWAFEYFLGWLENKAIITTYKPENVEFQHK